MRAAAVLLACGVMSTCGGPAATAPDSSPLPLRPGRQLLTLAGFASSVDPAFPACTPIGQPRDGTSVATIVLLAQEGAEWVARSEPALGSLELRLRGIGTSSGAYQVAGSVNGAATDIGLMGVVRDVRVTIGREAGGPSATLDGAMSPAGALVVGRIAGALRFSDSRGGSSTCPAIQWSMQAY
jgi:hypothetical protein